MATKKMQAAPDAKELRQREKAAQVSAPDQVRMKAGGMSALTAGVVVLAGLAIVGALYVGKELLIPITLALVLKLLLQPVMDLLSVRLRIPAAVSAFILIVCIFGTAVVVAFSISGPASSWLQKAPQVLPTLKEKLVLLRQPIDYLQGTFKELEDATTSTKDANVPTVAVKDTAAVASKLTGITLMGLGRVFTQVILLFFLLGAGGGVVP